MALAPPPPAVLTAEQFALRLDPGHPEELVKGRVVAMSPPSARHGQICAEAVWIFRSFVKPRDLGHVLCNDSGVITERDPDTVRGADVSFYSFARLPRGPLPSTYPAIAPDLVVEVRSPTDRGPDIQAKVAEYLGVGVGFVCVLDDASRTVAVHASGRPVLTLAETDALEFPDLLPGFRVTVRQFFE